MLTLSAWYISVLSFLFVLVSVLMMLIILVQKPKGGGLSGAFGGAGGGSTQSAFGARVGDVLTWATVVFFVLFITIAMGLTWTINPEQERLQRRAAQNAAAPPAAQQDPGDAAGPERDDGPQPEEVVEQSTPVLPQSEAGEDDPAATTGEEVELPEPTPPDAATPDS